MASTSSSCDVTRAENGARSEVLSVSAGVDNAGLANAIATARAGIAQYLDPGETRIVVAECAQRDSAFKRSGEAGNPNGLLSISYEVDSRNLLRIPYHGVPG